MYDYVLRTNDITKEYNKKVILQNVSMNIKKGEIYGLIGKNGAGKTTLMRIISRLTKQDSGNLSSFDINNKAEINKERARMGTLIESPRIYPHMTAEENLELIRLQRGIPGKKCIKEVLGLVSLKDVGKRKCEDFSLGMKQRLGISMALLNNPEFLILDEPINGLDPIGIKQIRKLLIKLNRERGITILITSHILSELSQLVTTYGFINNGKLLQEISKDELHKKCKGYLHIKVNDVEVATDILEKELKISDY